MSCLQTGQTVLSWSGPVAGGVWAWMEIQNYTRDKTWQDHVAVDIWTTWDQEYSGFKCEWNSSALAYNLSAFLNSQFLFKKQIAAVARKAFAQIHQIHQLYLYNFPGGLLDLLWLHLLWIIAVPSTWGCLWNPLRTAIGPELVQHVNTSALWAALATNRLLSAIHGADYHL